MIYIKNIEDFIKQKPVNKLSLEEAKSLYDKIVNDLTEHNYLYYVKSQPIVSDYEYDLLFQYLKELENKYPELIKPYSPTQRLVNQIQDELKKAKHLYPLLSLENTYNPDEVLEKLDKLETEVGVELGFYVEPKYDWLSIELIFEDWIFKQAITRWDWIIGEDVTENAKTIRTLPLKIPYQWKLHVRGEVVIKKSEFEKVNKKRQKEGLPLYSNPRNLASGSLRQLDPSITRERNLDVVVYEVLNWEEVWAGEFKYHHEVLNFLENQGFFVYDFKVIFQKYKDKIPENINYFKDWRRTLTKYEVVNLVKSNELKEILDIQEIEFDWLVIKVDEIKYWPVIGYTMHHPKWAFAFKYPAKQVSSQILNAELSVWRTGIITPVALLKPVSVGWVIVKRATLHNFDFIKEKDIHIQDYVWVIRSGEVIPYIEGVIRQSDDKQPVDLDKQEEIIKQLQNYFKENYDEDIEGKLYLDYVLKYKLYEKQQLVYKIQSPYEEKIFIVKIVEPPFCPVCWGETFHPEWEVALRCINVTCPAQVKEKIVHFVSKDWLDIEGLSEKTIETFLKAELISDYGDIFYLPEKKHLLLALPGFQEKKVNNIISSILEKTKIELPRFLAALGIEFVWKKTAKLVVEGIKPYIENWENIDFKHIISLLVSDKGENILLSIKGIGPKVVSSIRKFFSEPHNLKVIDKILPKITLYLPDESKWKFVWQTIVITGSVEWISRDKIADFIEKNWWNFSNQVTQDTTLLLVWEKPGKSKLSKAEKYKIPTYDLKKFLKENGFDIKWDISQQSLFW